MHHGLQLQQMSSMAGVGPDCYGRGSEGVCNDWEDKALVLGGSDSSLSRECCGKTPCNVGVSIRGEASARFDEPSSVHWTLSCASFLVGGSGLDVNIICLD